MTNHNDDAMIAAAEALCEEAETLTVAKQMTKQLRAHRANYVETTTHRGTKSLHNGDTVAMMLKGRDPWWVASLADVVCDEEPGYHAARYERLNPGQVRMNSGNRIRGAIKNGTVTADWVAEQIERSDAEAMKAALAS